MSKRGVFALSAILWLVIRWPATHTEAKPQIGEIPLFLKSQVQNFDNGGEPLLPTLLQIAGKYRIPMGIEQITAESTRSQLDVRLARGTVADLLNICVSRLPGYAWTVQGGAINIYGQKEWEDPSNLFNHQVSNFVSKDSTLNDANNQLRGLVYTVSATVNPEGPSHGTVGYGGDYPGLGTLEAKRVSIVMENQSVRSILNRITVLSASSGQQVSWVANVPPDRLAKAPQNGLWRLVPVGEPFEPESKRPAS